MTKNILIAALAIAVIALLIYRRKQEQTGNVCFDLVNSPSPSEFGPSYWKAFHSLAERIPCGGCRTFAEKFVSYWHDITNSKLSKPLYDEKNFVDMTNMICSIKDNGYKFPSEATK